MTSTTCAAVAGASAAPPLITALVDALDDLGLKRLVVGQSPAQNNEEEEEEQAYHQSVWRAYRDDRGGMSLTVARKLLGMALTAQEMKEILRNSAAIGRGGIMTWGDIEAVCREMGCPTCCCAGTGTGTSTRTSGTNAEQEDKDDNDHGGDDDEEDNDAKAHRKVELTLFLAAEVECRRLSKIGSGPKMVSSPSPPSTKTSSAAATSKPNTNLLQKLIEITPPGQEISYDQLKAALQQSTSATPDQIDKILECNRALQADYSLRKKMMMQKFDATAIAMARSRRQAKKKDSGKDALKSNEETGAEAQGDTEEEAAMDPVEVEIREIAASIANMDISSSSNNKAVDTSSRDVIVQQFLLPSTRFGSATQMQIMKGDVDTYDRGGRIDQDDRNSMPAWQNTRQEGTPPRTPAGGKSPTAGRSKKKKTPKKQSTPKKEGEEAKDEIPGSDGKIEEDMKKVVEEPKDASNGPSSTRTSSRRRRGKGKNKGNANATPGTSRKQEKVQDAASSETNTPVKSSKLDFEDAKDGVETPATDTASSSAKKRSSKRRRPKKSGEATPKTGDKQKSATGGDSKGGDDKKSETPASKEGQGDGKNRNSRRRHRGRGKPSQKSTEAHEIK